MSYEDAYIIEQFNQNFIYAKSENIVIYGTGVHTRELLLNLVDKNRILGLMDAAKTGQTIYGMKVLSYEEVERLAGNVCIVIIARNSVINVIYRRIQAFVEENGIPVYSISGEELKSDILVSEQKKCFSLNKSELVKKIDKAEMVSFDIFDTLLCRCVLRPTDVFLLMDEALSDDVNDFLFSKERMRAESELDIANYNIYDIYHRLQVNTGISNSQRDKLLALELQTEKVVLMPRKGMCEILDYALQNNKKVFLISDMYIPSYLLKDILDSKGIAGYNRLIVSTDYKSSKTEQLFEMIRDEINIDSFHWLHVGDNQYSDIDVPGKLGIDTFQVYGTVEMFEQSIYTKLLEHDHSIEENVMIANYAAMAFNNPFGGFDDTGKVIINSNEKLVRLFVAPVIFKYMMWLIQRIEEKNNDLVIFPSRDGYLLKKIYACLENENLPKSIYLYTSRRAAMIAAADNDSLIKNILDVPDTRNLQDTINARFGVDFENICTVDDLSYSEYSELKKACQKEQSRYRRYLDKTLSDEFQNVAFIDFVAMGTVQEALQRIIHKEFQGLYFMRRVSDGKGAEKLRIDSLYPETDDFSSESKIYQYYYFLENIMSSYEPGVAGFDEKGNPVFYPEKRSMKQLECLKQCHTEIVEYCKELFAVCPDLYKWNSDVDTYDQILGFFSEDYSIIGDLELLKIYNVDEFMGKQITEINR